MHVPGFPHASAPEATLRTSHDATHLDTGRTLRTFQQAVFAALLSTPPALAEAQEPAEVGDVSAAAGTPALIGTGAPTGPARSHQDAVGSTPDTPGTPQTTPKRPASR